MGGRRLVDFEKRAKRSASETAPNHFRQPFFAGRVFCAAPVPRLTAAFFRGDGLSDVVASVRFATRFAGARLGATRVEVFARTPARGARFGTTGGSDSDSGAASDSSTDPFPL